MFLQSHLFSNSFAGAVPQPCSPSQGVCGDAASSCLCHEAGGSAFDCWATCCRVERIERGALGGGQLRWYLLQVRSALHLLQHLCLAIRRDVLGLQLGGTPRCVGRRLTAAPGLT